jgi:hypothetical protein
MTVLNCAMKDKRKATGRRDVTLGLAMDKVPALC